MKILAIFLWIMNPLEIQNTIKSGDLFFISKGERSSYFLVFFEDGNGGLYDWGGSFRSKFSFEWNLVGDLYLVNFKDDTYQRVSLVRKSKCRLQVVESDSIPFQYIRVLPYHRDFNRVGKNKFKRRYKEFLGQEAFQRLK